MKHRKTARLPGHRRGLRLTAFCLAAGLLFSGCTAQKFTVERTEQNFSDIVYQRPDSEAILEKMDEVEAALEKSILPFKVVGALGELNELQRDYYSMYTIAMIRNSIDVTDPFYSSEVDTLRDEDAVIQNRSSEMYDKVLDSKFGSTFGYLWGEDAVADQKLRSESTSSAILDLQEEENKLISQYYSEFAKATVLVDGKEVLFSGLTAEEQSDYQYDFYRKYNPVFGELFRKLVHLRDEMAERMGFEDYTEVADREMLRTAYGREEIQQYREALKETIAPVYSSYLEEFYSRVNRYYWGDTRSDNDIVYLFGEPNPHVPGSWKDTLSSLQQLYGKMSRETEECFNYMYSHGFIEVAPSENKANMSFTTTIYNLNTPFLFSNFNGTSEDVQTFTHEFGHSLACYLQQELGSDSEGRSMDVCEIHSQAMQVLSLPYLDEVYPTEEEAEAAGKYTVYTILSGILSAAADDEFQEEIYQNPDMTLEEINALYRQLLLDYGLMVESPYTDLDSACLQWFQVNQYFETPFYSIDYALSGCVALEFLELMEEDYDLALDTYFMLVRQNANYDFFTVLEETGLSNPFEQEQLEMAADAVQRNLGSVEQQAAAA